MTPLQAYQRDLRNHKIDHDAKQAVVIDCLQDLYNTLLAAHTSRSWLSRLTAFLKRRKNHTGKGLYIWGGVGIGKTYLLDTFFDALPFKNKLRLHFHRFMQQVHADLQRLQGHPDPLTIVARHFALRAQVLCIDEFMVHDITDAMILARLLEALFARHICLVTTSNQHPDELYQHGLQRQRFLPAIALLKQQLQLLHIDSQHDYRLQVLTRLGAYFTPLNESAEQAMRQCFELYAHHAGIDDELLIIDQRPIKTRCLADKVVWFDFDQICHSPRSQMDYLAIARQFKIVLISNVPQIKAHEIDKVTYLINLVDIFYDQRVYLVMSAETSIPEIYVAGEKIVVFQRTASRLQEMQSEKYLTQLF